GLSAALIGLSGWPSPPPDAFLAALRAGDFDGLVAVLDPDVVVRADQAVAGPRAPREVRGARTWAKQALSFARGARFTRVAVVDGARIFGARTACVTVIGSREDALMKRIALFVVLCVLAAAVAVGVQAWRWRERKLKEDERNSEESAAESTAAGRLGLKTPPL